MPDSQDEPQASEKIAHRRNLMRLLKRAAPTKQPDRPEPAVEPPPPPPVAPTPGNRLSRMSPFSIGFMGTLGVMAAYALVVAAAQVQSVLVLAVVALFLALGLNPLVMWLTKFGLGRGSSVAIVIVGMLTIVILGSWAVVPLFSQQINLLIAYAPEAITNIARNEAIAEFDAKYQLLSRLTAWLATGQWVDSLFGGVVGAGKLLANTVFSLVVTLVLTLYFLVSLPAIKNTIYRLAPASRRPRARYLADQMFAGIGGYLTGMFVIVTVAAICSFVFLNIVGLGKYAVALAFVVMLFDFIPLVGSSIAMVLVAIVGFSESPAIGIAIVIYFLAYQQFEAYVAYPRVMQRSANVPGPIVVLAAIIGGMLLGVIGAILAIPIAAVLLLLYREVLLVHLDNS